MMAEITFAGQVASAGFASGPIFIAEGMHAAEYQPKGSVTLEVTALTEAVEHALAATSALIERAEGDAADILEFQLAMLGDETFPDAAKPLIEAGQPADQAWSKVLDAEIAGYAQSADEYFRARAADLSDIRDRVLAMLRGDTAEAIRPGCIYVADDITPSRFLAHDWSTGGLALRKGSATSHVAMLARQRGVPMIVGIGQGAIEAGSPTLLNAATGQMVLNPHAEAKAIHLDLRMDFEQKAAVAATFLAKPARTADGYPITVLVNIGDPSDIDTIDINHVDGVGLMRTEFLYNAGLPDEESQLRAYRKVLEWARGKPVTIRTVDAGGDKPVPGFTEEEDNPFLGIRGIRLCLAKPEIFAVQVRALLRAGVLRNLKVMLPMVSAPEEIEAARDIFEAEKAKLTAAGIHCAMPDLGIMVEVPAVAITPWRFNKASFFSIGSNDLTQYVMAASRDSSALAALAKPDNPAVLQLIGNVARHGLESGVSVSLCGDAASDPGLAPKLIEAGVYSLSVAASRIGAIKAAIAALTLDKVGKPRD